MARILVIDDDPDVVDACRLVLEGAGHEAAGAHNVDEGMAAIEKQKPDLLILDVMMDQPDDGIKLAQELRSRSLDLPIIMMTSVGKASGMDFGKDDEMVPVNVFLEKPVEPAALVAQVNELLKS